jgi:carboxypeptidase Taq
MKAYKALEDIFNRIHQLESIGGILGWDMSTMMPEKSADVREEQFKVLETLSHEYLTSSKTADLIQEAEETAGELDDWQQTNLALMRRSYDHASVMNPSIIKHLIEARTACEMNWRTAKEENDFRSYEPLQQTVLDITRDIATRKAELFNTSPYEAMLDEYDRGRKTETIDTVFTDLKAFLPDFIKEVVEKQQSEGEIITPTGTFPAAKQKELGKRVMKAIGFDFTRGRIDESLHPFCGGAAGDIRITTRYDEHSIFSGLMGVIHESGHAMYDNQLPKKWRGQPVGDSNGMAIHESQSLLAEMQACRGDAFISFISPLLKETFGDDKAWEKKNLKRLYTKVEPSLIRVDADEVTYPMHVILRYEIEKGLLSGEYEICDLPNVWSEKMYEYLGISVPDYAQGCMQDIHWTDGSFGYFPTYTLGAIIASQLFDAAKKQNAGLDDAIAKGDFTPLMSWLGENVHAKGARLTPDELVEDVTGAPLSVETFKAHLKERYLDT